MRTLKLSYDYFPDVWYEKVENIVLGEHKFNEEQKKFIHYYGSSKIEAGPGTGKTTALSAKVALLLKKLEKEGSLSGICVITHTNAAVDEILKVLKRLGYKDIPHPHFIGTIHSFFNKYLLPKVYYTEISNAPLKFIDYVPDWEYKESILHRHHWLNKGPMRSILRRLNKVKYNIELFHFRVKVENTENWDKFPNYESTFNYAIRERFKKGLLLHDDTLLIVNQLLKKNKYMHRMLRKRFKYVLIDEYQDTENESISNLINIFNHENNIIQLIGDKNQHIYYDRNVLSTMNIPIHQLNITNRFGDKIAAPLNRMFGGELVTQENNKSISPILYIYNKPEKLVIGFNKILKQHQINIEQIPPSILVAEHTHAEHMKQETNRNTENNSKTSFQIIQNEIYKLLVSRTNIHVQSIRNKLCKKYKTYHIEINKSVINYLRGDSISKIKDSVNSFLNRLEVTSFINLSNNLFNKIKAIKDSSTYLDTSDTGIIQTRTIHNIKGQTLVANMVYLTEGSRQEYGFLESYTSLIPQPKGYLEIDKRVIYVAMSRATTLLVIALHENAYNKLPRLLENELNKDFKILWENQI